MKRNWMSNNDVVQKIDTRKLLEKTNYFKKKHINNFKQWYVQWKTSWAFFYFYLFAFCWFAYFLYIQYNDIKLMMRTPIIWLWILIFWIWLYLLTKWKTTLKWVKPIYEIWWNMASILKDNSLKKYNKKNKECYNELKVIEIKIK